MATKTADVDGEDSPQQLPTKREIRCHSRLSRPACCQQAWLLPSIQAPLVTPPDAALVSGAFLAAVRRIFVVVVYFAACRRLRVFAAFSAGVGAAAVASARFLAAQDLLHPRGHGPPLLGGHASALPGWFAGPCHLRAEVTRYLQDCGSFGVNLRETGASTVTSEGTNVEGLGVGGHSESGGNMANEDAAQVYTVVRIVGRLAESSRE